MTAHPPPCSGRGGAGHAPARVPPGRSARRPCSARQERHHRLAGQDGPARSTGSGKECARRLNRRGAAAPYRPDGPRGARGEPVRVQRARRKRRQRQRPAPVRREQRGYCVANRVVRLVNRAAATCRWVGGWVSGWWWCGMSVVRDVAAARRRANGPMLVSQWCATKTPRGWLQERKFQLCATGRLHCQRR